MKYLLLLFTITFHGQVLHHQMLSSQGTSKELKNGLVVRQTVGQQSIIGSSISDKLSINQGFQQNAWSKLVASNKSSDGDFKMIIYPNPFIDIVNFQFSKVITDLINITIFDVAGRMILQENKKIAGTVLTIDLSNLPASVYLVQLRVNNFNYYTKIIKQ